MFSLNIVRQSTRWLFVLVVGMWSFHCTGSKPIASNHQQCSYVAFLREYGLTVENTKEPNFEVAYYDQWVQVHSRVDKATRVSCTAAVDRSPLLTSLHVLLNPDGPVSRLQIADRYATEIASYSGDVERVNVMQLLSDIDVTQPPTEVYQELYVRATAGSQDSSLMHSIAISYIDGVLGLECWMVSILTKDVQIFLDPTYSLHMKLELCEWIDNHLGLASNLLLNREALLGS